MSYLGLDLSLTSAGFFLLREDGTNKNFTIRTKPGQFSSSIRRARAIAEKILEGIKNESISLVLLEDYFVGQNAQTVIKLAILGTIVRDQLSLANLPYVTAKPSQIKKFETGKGNFKKDVMIKHVFQNHKFDTNSNDIADACAMAYLCRAYCQYQLGQKDFLKYQLEVLKAMHEIEKPY